MTAGAILPPSRPRFQSNERLDSVDAQAISDAELMFLDAYSRSITSTPAATGGTTPTGMIIQGFGLTLNPTSGSDNRVRVQSPAGVCFDSNGRMIIKASGVTTDLTLPSGTSQIYAYYIDDQTDIATRRFISVTSPYAESSEAIATTFTSDVGYLVQPGDQTSIVASAVVNGATTALCFLGVATNTAGTITMTGYNTVTAPNGQYAVNRLSAVVAPATAPAGNANNGSIASVTDMVKALGYSLGEAMFAGSAFLTPSAANDYGAYVLPSQWSLQRLGEQISAKVAGSYPNIQTFTTSGTYTPSANLAFIVVEQLAAGGGGGGMAAPGIITGGMCVGAGTGGDGGTYAKYMIPGSAVGSGGAITIGTGGAHGAGNANGSAGIGTHVTIASQSMFCAGGAGGHSQGVFQSDSGASTIAIGYRNSVVPDIGAITAGLSALGGTLLAYSYGYGQLGMAAYYTGSFTPSPAAAGQGGIGGASPLGVPGFNALNASSLGGGNGFGYGGTGTAIAQNNTSAVSLNGDDGGPGIVIITEYIKIV